VRSIVSQVLGTAMRGIAIGSAGAFALTRVISSFLYGITAADPSTFALVALLLSAASAIATLVPGRRAARIDPIDALRMPL